MKIVIAMDSFKGSLTSLEAGHAVEAGIRRVMNVDILVKPIADGGEGTTEALVDGMGGAYRTVEVTGPLGEKVKASYGILPNQTAVMEMAQAAGIMLVDKNVLNPLQATTYGVGEMLVDAIRKGCRKILLGIGGSATSDGGVGMLQALGYEFLNANGEEIQPGIEHLDEIVKIKTDKVLKEIKECHFEIACDVRNPLLGEQGAVYVYGPQKGIAMGQREVLDQKMRHYAEMTRKYMGTSYEAWEGAGAAGGMGFACLSYLPNVVLRPGIEMILDAVNFEEEIKGASYVVTGEGRMDGQTAMGKTPVGIAKLAKKYNVKVLAFAGSVTEDANACNLSGIDAFFPIVRGVTTLEEAMEKEQAKKNMEETVEQVFRLLK